MSRKPRPQRPAGPPADHSLWLYVRMNPEHLALFRFLLEGCDNLGYATVLDRHTALVRLVHSLHQAQEAAAFLSSIADLVPHQIIDTVAAA